MITVVTFEELKKLYRDQAISKSENFDFLSDKVQEFVAEVYKEEHGVDAAKVIYLYSLDQQPITTVGKEVLDDSNGDILSSLPQLEGDQICLVVKPSTELLYISDITLEDLEEAQTIADEEKEYYTELLTKGENKEDSHAVYAITETVKLSDVVSVLYPEELQEQIDELEKSEGERKVLFQKTNLFS